MLTFISTLPGKLNPVKKSSQMSAWKNRNISILVLKKYLLLCNKVQKENAAENQSMHEAKYCFCATFSNGQQQSFLLILLLSLKRGSDQSTKNIMVQKRSCCLPEMGYGSWNDRSWKWRWFWGLTSRHQNFIRFM